MKLESENFTIYEIKELKDKLLEEFQQSEDIQIDLSNVIKIDMTAIQLLLSLKKSCENQNKSFKIKGIDANAYRAFQLSGCDTALGV